MPRFRHAANPSDCLNFKRFVHVLTQFDQNMRSRTVPTGGDSLFDNNRDWLGVRLFDTVQILFLVRQPDG